jgi:methionyl-tRNA formyltransferase
MAESPLSIIFCGTSAFAAPSLRALLADPDFRVDLVITQPDQPVGRKQVLTAPPVKELALEKGIDIYQPESLRKEFFSSPYATKRPDYLVVVSYGQILSQEMLDFPLKAPINVHASLLPRWRGASPLQHTILHGDTVSGVTIQRMVKELDAGPVLLQEQYTLDPRETFTTLHDQLAETGARLLVQALKHYPQEQEQDPSGITLCPKFTKDDGFANPEAMTAVEIDRRVRALNPWPGVRLMLEKDIEPMKILETSLEPTAEAHPLSCKDGTTLYLCTVQPAGKKPMTGAAWARGYVR